MQDTLRKARARARRASLRGCSPHAQPARLPRLGVSRPLTRPLAPRQLHEAAERSSELDSAFAMSSMERMRARCTVPRDVVLVYESLNKVGLQYGPAFRLLTDVYVPEAVANAQGAAHAAGHA